MAAERRTPFGTRWFGSSCRTTSVVKKAANSVPIAPASIALRYASAVSSRVSVVGMEDPLHILERDDDDSHRTCSGYFPPVLECRQHIHVAVTCGLRHLFLAASRE